MRRSPVRLRPSALSDHVTQTHASTAPISLTDHHQRRSGHDPKMCRQDFARLSPILVPHERISLWSQYLCVPSIFVPSVDPCPMPPDALQNCGEAYAHTAHQSGFVKVLYRFHPFFQASGTVLRTSNRTNEPSVLVRVEPSNGEPSDSPDLRIVIPCWMLDQTACHRVRLCDKPVVPLSALLQLRQLADDLAGSSTQRHPERSSNVKGDCCEIETSEKAANPKADAQATEA